MSTQPRQGPPHVFTAGVAWGGPGARPTTEVRRFSRVSRAHAGPGVPEVHTSAARAFFGDRDAWNPETLLLAALAQCHLLAFLRTAGLAGHEVIAAEVQVRGELQLGEGDAGAFTSAVLSPATVFAAEVSDAELASLHERAHEQCFIANSLAFAVSVSSDSRSPETAPSGENGEHGEPGEH